MFNELKKELNDLLGVEIANGMVDFKCETSQTKENSTRELVWLARNALSNFQSGNFTKVQSFRVDADS